MNVKLNSITRKSSVKLLTKPLAPSPALSMALVHHTLRRFLRYRLKNSALRPPAHGASLPAHPGTKTSTPYQREGIHEWYA